MFSIKQIIMQGNENILSTKELPPLNLRIKELIDRYSNGSVKKFSEVIQLSSSQKINRIFNVDKRNGEFPEASSDILICIANMLSEVDMNWLLTGHGSMLRNNQEQPVPQTSTQTAHSESSSNEAAVYYKMYKEKDAEAGELKEEVGILKERLRQLEKTQNSTDEHRASVEKEPDAFTTATSGGSGKDAVHIRRAASLQTSLPAKT